MNSFFTHPATGATRIEQPLINKKYMKLLNPLMALIAVFGVSYTAQAQISVLSTGAGPITFDTRPNVADGWATASNGNSSATIGNAAQLTSAVQLLNANTVIHRVGNSASDPLTDASFARYNSTRMRLQTKATTIDYLVLMATLRNDTGQDITSFAASYLYAVEPAGTEEVPGHLAFYSVTGAPGSWSPISAFSGVTTNGTLTATITPSGWSPGLNLYILWADDNAAAAATTGEGGYTIDDFTIANVVTTSLPVSIAITSPTNTQQVIKGSTVNVATTTTGPILSVDFRLDGASVLVDTTPPFGFTADATTTESLPLGTHTLQAFASDGAAQTPSAVVTFQVVANNPPVIVITNLVAPTNFLVGTAIPVNARITDDISVTNVDWFVDGNLFVTRAGVANLGFTYVNSLAGTHTIHGVATDSTGQPTTSASVTVGVTNPPSATFALLVTNGSEWKYSNSGSEPVDPFGAPWYGFIFEDETWASALAEIGGGDRADGYPEHTTIDIGPNPGRFSAIYFRKTFSVSNPALYPNVVLRLLRDDGAVVYINELPVWTNNMATTDFDITGNIAYTNLALGSDDGLTYQTVNLPSSVLGAGLNLVAVEVHQQNATSSDLSFDLMLWGESATAPILSITSPTNGQSFVAGAPVTANITASTFITNVTLLVDGTAVGSDDTRPFSIVASNLAVGTRTLVARGRDSFGVVGNSPAVTITIVPNQLPTVVMTNPPTNVELLVGSTILLGAAAADTDGTLTHVEFYDNGTLINTDTTIAGFDHTEVDLTAGVHLFTAKAYDNSGASTTSAPLTVTVTNPPSTTALLTNRSEWKWAAITNADLGNNWFTVGFNDSAWNVGSGKFGFGGDGEKTVVGGTNIPSFYFRKVITVANPSAYSAIVIGAVRDDGIAIHVNGNVVYTNNMIGAPPFSFDALAGGNTGGENTYLFSTNATSIFSPGQNTIAVEVHQVNLTSSDIGFDLMIFGAAAGCPNPTATYNGATRQVTVSWSGGGQLYSSANVAGPYNTLSSATSPFTFTPSGAMRFFRVRCD